MSTRICIVPPRHSYYGFNRRISRRLIGELQTALRLEVTEFAQYPETHNLATLPKGEQSALVLRLARYQRHAVERVLKGRTRSAWITALRSVDWRHFPERERWTYIIELAEALASRRVADLSVRSFRGSHEIPDPASVALLLAKVFVLANCQSMYRLIGKGGELRTRDVGGPVVHLDPYQRECIDLSSERLGGFMLSAGVGAPSVRLDGKYLHDLSVEGADQLPIDPSTDIMTIAWRHPPAVDYSPVSFTQTPVGLAETLCFYAIAIYKVDHFLAAAAKTLGLCLVWTPRVIDAYLIIRLVTALCQQTPYLVSTLMQYGYCVVPRDLVWGAGQRHYDTIVATLPRSLIDAHVPRSLDRVIARSMMYRSSVDPPMPGPYIHPLRSAIMIDALAASCSLSRWLEFPRAGSQVANAFGHSFEDSLQAVIDDSPWRPTEHYRSLRRRVLLQDGRQVSDIDAIGIRGACMLCVSAKSIAFSCSYYRGDYKTVRNVESTIREAVDHWAEIEHKIVGRPVGDNYDVRGIRQFIFVVVTPFASFTSHKRALEEVAHRLRRASSFCELEEWLQAPFYCPDP